MRHTPVVGVVVVTYRSEKEIVACLTALDAAASAVRLEPVVVVDNASDDATVALAVGARPDVVVLRAGGNLGYAAAINLACERAVPEEVDAVLVLNPDTLLAPGAVDALVAGLADGVGIVVPRMSSPQGVEARSLRRWPGPRTAWSEALLGGGLAGWLGWGEVVTDPAAYREPHDVQWATGAAVLVGARARATLGAWDESFFLYSEETELMLRAHRAGLSVRYEPSAHCIHQGGASGASPELWALLVVNKVRLYERDNARGATVCFRLGLLVGQQLRAWGGSRSAAAAVKALRGGPVLQGDPRPVPPVR